MAKQKTKFSSVKNDPFLQQQTGLQFDNLTEEQLIEQTPQQQATAWLSRYMEAHDPIAAYAKYFDTSVKGIDWEFSQLKNFYVQLVVSEKWSEEKFVSVVNGIFSDRQIMGAVLLDARGRIYDQQEESSRSSRNSRRRGRL